jgi:hypothetical protein
MSNDLKVGDRVRHMRVMSGSDRPRKPSKAAGVVTKISNGWIWVRFTSEAGIFDRRFREKHVVREGEQ